MSIFPSLSAGVVPIEPIVPLECLTVSSDWEVVHLTNTHQINLHFNIIMSHHSDATCYDSLGHQYTLNLNRELPNPASTSNEKGHPVPAPRSHIAMKVDKTDLQQSTRRS